MPRTVKLTSADARAWRENHAQWVSPDGYVLRAVTAEEEAALFPAVARAKQFKKNGRCTVEAEYRVRDAETEVVRTEKVPLEVMLKVIRTGREEGSFLVETYVGGNKYVKGRDILRSRILEKHGECILQGTNGKQLTVIRDPLAKRPSFAESQRMSPSPERCHCRGFSDNPDPGRHHLACEWNAKAPPHERALPIEREGLSRGLLDLPTPLGALAFASPSEANVPRVPPAAMHRTAQGRPLAALTPSQAGQGGLAALAQPVVMSGPGGGAPAGAPIYATPPLPPGVSVARTPRASSVRGAEKLEPPPAVSPKDCDNDCRGLQNATRGWAWPAGRTPEPGQHHPLCKHDGPWRERQGEKRRWMLYDVDRRRELREATPDEVAAGEIELKRSGIRSVKVGDGLYAVVEAGKDPLEDSAPTRAHRPSPAQDALRLPDSASTGLAPSVVGRPAASAAPAAPSLAEPPLSPGGADGPSDEEIDAEISRLMALRSGKAPGASPAAIFAPPVPPSAELLALPELPELPPLAQAPAPDWGERSVVVAEDPSLRDELGLVGLQRKTSDIEPGPVMVVPPEEFVDPLAAAG